MQLTSFSELKKPNSEKCTNAQRGRSESRTHGGRCSRPGAPRRRAPVAFSLLGAGLRGGARRQADAAGPGLRRRGAGSRAVSRAGQFAREPGAGAPRLQVGGNGSASGAEGKPGWRLRVGRRRLQAPCPPRELSREIPRRRSRARERARPRRRHCRCSRPGLSWKALSSAS